jgi:hypothetical protein
MSSSISSLGVFLDTYNTLTLVGSLNGKVDTSSASDTAQAISNVLKTSESSSSNDSASDTTASVTSSDTSSSEDSSNSAVSVYA